jgi:hypothetical protein
MHQYKYNIIALLVFSVCYFYFALSGAIIHNDTVAYVGFAKEIRNGVLPHSSLFQPGAGFFIAVLNYFSGLSFFNAFRLLNFIYGIGVILLLNRIFFSISIKRSFKVGFIVFFSSSPFVALFSNFLYADIGFVFYTLLSLFILSKYTEKRKLYLLFISSFFVGISIFTKYNGLSVLLTGLVFLLINGYKNKSIIESLKDIILFSIIPMLYLLFWKKYNGNLGGVEFKSYMKVVNLECMIQYLKVNVISLYHLFLETIFFSAHAYINHYFLILPFILVVSGFIYFFKKQIQLYISVIKNDNRMLIIYLISVVYILSVIGIQSLNCLTEISIRSFLLSLIVLHFLLIHFLIFVFKQSDTTIKKIISFVLLLFILFFNLYYLVEYKIKYKQFMVSKSNNKYMSIMSKVELDTSIKTIYSTPGFTREFYLLKQKQITFQDIPYQSYYDYDVKIELSNDDYFKLIKKNILNRKNEDVLVIEFDEKFLNQYSDSLKVFNILLKENNTYFFK